MNTRIVPSGPSCANDEPLVSIGVPVRNGAVFLSDALELLLNQTHRNLEIVISDNNSGDGTADIIARYAARDARIHVHRHGRTLTAFENFRFVFEQTRGEYFLWAACDDRRSLDYVERLLSRLRERRDASLVFGEVAEISDASHWQGVDPMSYEFETRAEDSVSDRLMRYTRMNCLHIYGLIRSSALRAYRWVDIDNGPDMPLLVHLSLAGEFVRAAGGRFYYYIPPVQKSREERAATNSLKKLTPLPEIRLAWACARTAHRTGQAVGRPIALFRAFLIVYSNRHWRWIKPALFNLAPSFLIKVYRTFLKQKSR